MAGGDERRRADRTGGSPGGSSPAPAARLAWDEVERLFAEQDEAGANPRLSALLELASRWRIARRTQILAAAGLCLLLLLAGAWLVVRTVTADPSAPVRAGLPVRPPIRLTRPAPASPPPAPRPEPLVRPAPASVPGAPPVVARTGAPAHEAGSARDARALRKAGRDLADAYASALEAPVDPQYLALYSQRWSALRQDAADDPVATAAAYRVMTGELTRLAHDTRASAH